MGNGCELAGILRILSPVVISQQSEIAKMANCPAKTEAQEARSCSYKTAKENAHTGVSEED